jgi:membrane-bound inhibitor of C-type lysozyme
MKTASLLLVLTTATALAACATRPDTAERRIAYTCDGGPPVTVVYAGETARIENPDGGEPIVLQRRKSGSGLWYESPTHTVRSKGDEIVYTIGRRAPMICRAAITPQPR